MSMPEDHWITTDSEFDVDYVAKKREIIILLLVYSAIFGVICIYLPDADTPLDFVAGLPLLILGVSWCFTDANERDHRIGILMRLSLVLFFILAFPLYLFQTRGLHGFKALLLSMCLVIVMAACAFSALYLGIAAGLAE